MLTEKTEWFENLHTYRHIMIFGAQYNARETYQGIKKEKCDIECYIVSERGDNPFILDGKPVKVFDEIRDEIKEKGLVIISQQYEDNERMKKILYSAGFQNVIPSRKQRAVVLTERMQQYCFSILGK